MFTEAQKRIYKVCDGRVMDPLVIRRKLIQETKGKLNDALELSSSSDDLAAVQAQETLATAARAAFGFPPLDETGAGATEQDCLDELTRFLEWQEGKG